VATPEELAASYAAAWTERDERKRLEHEVQKLTDETIKEIDDLAQVKEKEILGK
jgi:ribosome recycling factor